MNKAEINRTKAVISENKQKRLQFLGCCSSDQNMALQWEGAAGQR